MRRSPFLPIALAFASVFAARAGATLNANNLTGSWATANLVQSRMTVTLGPQWIDIEEEAELQVAVPGWSEGTGPWIVEGTFELPQGTALVGCMLWNGDTLLMGKLRAKADAQRIFDSLVPPRAPAWPRDPLLVEQLSNTSYSLKLYPFATNGTRRFRLRYLVPLGAGETSLSVFPRMARAISGSRPSKFRLRLRGTGEDLKIERGGMVWPVSSPSSELLDCAGADDILLRWPSTKARSGVRGHQDSGAWAGDFVRYSGSLADSVLSRTYKRSETVVLWRWINPRSNFFYSGYSSSGTYRYLSSYGQEAIQQATALSTITRRKVQEGSRVGMVLDEGLGDDSRIFPLGDSSSASYKKLSTYLEGVNETYLRNRIPELNQVVAGEGNPALEVSRSRQRFVSEIREVATLYSADSGIVRHLVVVTTGLQETWGDLEQVEADLLPAGVSVTASRLVGGATYSAWDYITNTYRYYTSPPPASVWPGIDLQGFVGSHPATGDLDLQNGVLLPKGPRASFAARLSIASSAGRISSTIVLQRDGSGRYRANFDVHGPSLGRSLTWNLYDEKGEDLAQWEETPDWIDVGADSAFPRLWAKSAAPLSPVFEDRDLGPVFGVVDRAYSLLATPTDTVGFERQRALLDSGVPFLSAAEIFARQAFGEEQSDPTTGDPDDPITLGADPSRRGNGTLALSWMAGLRTLRIGLKGLQAQGIEIRDLRGRLLASLPASQLAGLESYDWRVPEGFGRGVLLVSVRTATGIRTGRVLVN